VESNENNNTHQRTITVLPNAPDIVAKSYSIGTVYDCNTTCFSFYLGNDGGVATGIFDAYAIIYKNGILDTAIQQQVANMEACTNRWIQYCYDFDDATANYTVRMFADSVNAVTEYLETNNQLQFDRNPVQCQADLIVVRCGTLTGIEVTPVDPASPGNINLTAEIRNTGNASATNFDVSFTINQNGGGTTTYTVNYPGTLNGGQRDIVTINNIANVPFGDHDLVVVVDANEVINERNENNNTSEVPFCYEFNLAELCYTVDFWERNQPVFQPVVMRIRARNTGVFDASAVDVKFEVSGPGIVGWQLIDKADQIPASSTICATCSHVFTCPTPYAFQQVGVFQVRMTIDSDGNYDECDETNNVMIVDVNVVSTPDMRVLSQYINPSLLNPDLNEDITFDVTYENIGVSNVQDSMELFIMVDEIPLDSIRVGGLANGDFNTINFATPWSSNLVGAHVARIIIDNDNEVFETHELNNEATRALIIGQSPDLYANNFCTQTPNPSLNSSTILEARIYNDGDTSCNADVQFYYVDGSLDTILIGTLNIDVNGQDSLDITYPWNNVFTPTTLILRIVNADPEEARTDNNEAFCFIGSMLVTTNVDSTATCTKDGQAFASISGGTAPYNFVWSDLSATTGNTLIAPGGNYDVTVTDVNGLQATGQVFIPQSGGILAPTYTTADTCSPTILTLSAGINTADSYSWSGPYGFNFTGSDTTIQNAYVYQSGAYSVIASYNNGCTAYGNMYVQIDTCCSDTIFINDITCYAQNAGTFITTTSRQNNCDSITIQTYTYETPDTTYLINISCSVFNDGQETTITLDNYNGCDSVIITTLQYGTPDTTYLNNTTCNLGQVGQNTILDYNQYGCDSLVITNTAYLQADTTYLLSTSCDLNQVGQTSTLLTNNNGCDSLVITTTAYLQSDTTYLLSTSCDLNQVGQTSTLLTNNNGCDSLVITNTAYLQSDTTYLLSTSCDLNQVGQTSTLLTNNNGCDSLVITNTAYLQSDTTYLQTTSCDLNQVGQTSTLLTNNDGCDSLVITNTAYLQADTTYLQTTSCDLNQVGQTSTLLTNNNGCDSLVITNTAYLQADTTYLQTTSCNITQSPTDTIYLVNNNGCDSLVITTYNFVPSDSTFLQLTTCDGTLAGVNSEILIGNDGCDSVVVTTTLLLSSQTVNTSVLTCDPSQVGVITQVFSNQFGCDSIIVTNTILSPIPVLILSSDTTVCENELVQLLAFGGVTYDWSPGIGLSDSTISNPIAILDTTTTYQVIMTNTNGCSDTSSVTITVNPAPIIILPTNNITICNGDTVQVVATGIGAFNWGVNPAINNPFIPNPLLFPNFSQTFIVELTNSNGCLSADSVIISVQDLPIVNISSDATICESESIPLSATGGGTYQWSPSASLDNSTIANPIASPVVNTTYTVTVTNSFGCTEMESVTISVNDTITPTITQVGNTLQANPSNGIGYTWFYADTMFTNPTGNNVIAIGLDNIPADSTGYYRVRIEDINGCIFESTTIYIEPVSTTPNISIQNLRLMPNPTRDYVDIEFDNIKANDVEIRLVNELGQLILSEKIYLGTGQHRKRLDLSNIPQGVYIVLIKGENFVVNQRLIIAK
jgi:hypothetical protein